MNKSNALDYQVVYSCFICWCAAIKWIFSFQAKSQYQVPHFSAPAAAYLNKQPELRNTTTRTRICIMTLHWHPSCRLESHEGSAGDAFVALRSLPRLHAQNLKVLFQWRRQKRQTLFSGSKKMEGGRKVFSRTELIYYVEQTHSLLANAVPQVTSLGQRPCFRADSTQLQ